MDAVSHSATPTPPVAPQSINHWRVVGTVCIGAFMAALDASIVTVAIPTLHTFFHAPVGVVGWVAIAYLLTLSSLLIIFGHLADRIGRARMYAYGFTVFIIGSALCGLAPSIMVLIVSRILQASGAAMLQANSVALVTAYTPPRERGRAIGVQAAAQALGLSAGPAVGGGLLALFSWRALFYVNLPIGILGTLLALRFLPKDPEAGVSEPFDYAGAGMMIVGLVLFMWALNQGYLLGWGSWPIIASFVVAVLACYLFVRRQLGISHPILDLTLFRNWVFSSGNVSGLLSYTLLYGTLFLGPFELQLVQHLPISQEGLVLTAVPVAMTVLSPISGRLADRFSAKDLSLVGMAIGTVGAFWLAFTAGAASIADTLTGLVLVGIGVGLFTPPNNSSVMGVVPRARLSSAGGFLNMARSLGMSIGVAVAGSLYAGMLLATIGNDTPTLAQSPAVGHALMLAFVGIGVAALIATAISAVKPNFTVARGGDSEPQDLV